MVKMSQRVIFYFIFLVTCSGLNVTPNPQYTFEQCLVSKTSFGYCVGISALTKLQSIDNDPAFNIVDGVSFIRDEQRPRTLSNFLDRDPADFGGILDSVSHVMSYRMMRWDMSGIYPGLIMRVTPSVDGVLEFVMDPLQEELTLKSQYKEIGTARIMARHFVLPLLLGFKFKVATIIPLIFGLLALLAKKALFLSKIALIASSSLALGNLLLGSNYQSSHNQYNHHFPGHHHHNVYPSWGSHGAYKTNDAVGEYSDVVYKGYTGRVEDELKFAQFERNQGRNFAWSDPDKGSKQI